MLEFSILEAQNGGHYVMAKCETCLPFLGPVFQKPGDAVAEAQLLFKDFDPYKKTIIEPKTGKPFEYSEPFDCRLIKEKNVVPESDILLAQLLIKMKIPGASFGKMQYNKHVFIVFSAEGLFAAIALIAFDGTFNRIELPEVIIEETMLGEAYALGNSQNRELIQSFIKSL